MVQRFWRVRLGDKGNAELWKLCKSEKPPCIAVGWGESDLSKGIDDIERNWNQDYDEVFGGIDAVQIRRWVEMKKGDIVIAMRRPGTICAIGKIIQKRYHKEDDRFCMDIIGYNDDNTLYGEVLFYNRIDVDWLTNPNNDNIKVKDMGLPPRLKNKLNIPMTIIEIESDEYTKIKNQLLP